MRHHIELLVLVLSLLTSCDRLGMPARDSTDPVPQPAISKRHALTLEEVFAWRNRYGDLLGKSRDAAIERFGLDFKTDQISDGSAGLNWQANRQTDNRAIAIVVNPESRGGQIVAVKVFSRAGEDLDPLAVLRKAYVFRFESGTYTDSTEHYFTAETLDKRNSVQFGIAKDDIVFRAAVFTNGQADSLSNTR